MRIICRTGEKVNNIKEYYDTIHWETLKNNYRKSELSKICCKCKKSIDPIMFIHRTKNRLGNEKLSDIMPVCDFCQDKKPNRSKKQAERMQLAPMGFNPSKISLEEKEGFLSIEPELRGKVLTKYYMKKAKTYKPSSKWINTQVNKTCKWIRSQEKKLLQLSD